MLFLATKGEQSNCLKYKHPRTLAAAVVRTSQRHLTPRNNKAPGPVFISFGGLSFYQASCNTWCVLVLSHDGYLASFYQASCNAWCVLVLSHDGYLASFYQASCKAWCVLVLSHDGYLASFYQASCKTWCMLVPFHDLMMDI